MIIGKFSTVHTEEEYWAVGDDFDAVCKGIRSQIEFAGEDPDLLSPEKVEVWIAKKAKVKAVYSVE